MKEYRIKDLMKKWDLSRSGVLKKIKRDDLPTEKREVMITERQIVTIVTLEEA